MSFPSELLEATVKLIENVCDEKATTVTQEELCSAMSIITRLKERLETIGHANKTHTVVSEPFSTSQETLIDSMQKSPPHFDEAVDINNIKTLSKDVKNTEDELVGSTSDSINSDQVHRRLSQPSLQPIQERGLMNNNESTNSNSKDIFFNPFKRKVGRSASIYPQQARISMHSHQTPTGLTHDDEFFPGGDNWKQVSKIENVV